MKNQNKPVYLKIFTGAIMLLGGIVNLCMHSLLIYITFALNNNNSENKAAFIAVLISITICAVIQTAHGLIIALDSKKDKKRNFSFGLNCVLIFASAILIMLSVIFGVELMPVQMLTGIIIPALYFVVYFMTPNNKTKA